MASVGGLPPKWFARSKRVGPDPSRWAPAEEDAPDAVARLVDRFCRTVDDFGGRGAGLREHVRFEVSLDGRPRHLRLVLADEVREALLLWADADVELWVERAALRESQRQRFGSVSVPDLDDEWPDPMELRYQPLADRHPALATRLADHYVRLFLRLGRLSPDRADEARRSLHLDVSIDAERPVLQCTSRITGETRWLYDWDGSEAQALAFVEDQADLHGMWLAWERAHHRG